MITGRWRASGAMLRASATWRLIGCSMKSVAAQSCCSAGSASIALHSATTRVDVLVLLVAVERDVQWPGAAVEHRGDLHQPLEVGARSPPTLSLKQRWP